MSVKEFDVIATLEQRFSKPSPGVEVGIGDDGAVRAGIVHYNTVDEVDRLLTALSELV